ncbi:hypothetical protein RVR_9727 [Actinacidiphila reveromycinica]|uniref:Uncharacterized protein n=1 Tax=Actinacidiphila reveromycinica TaxID=659352 RepID=A0A7U3UXE9_9ACTN|nr:hypothetical protein [Streptomyces sp. SN-593]BBB02031.1 hypothetical protein RVR_9727 [Streptomyces sp. SN-593]
MVDVEDELAALAGAGAVAVVTAMSTELWQSVRGRVADLFRRSGRRRREVATRLDSHAALVESADAPDAVRRALTATWAAELESLLRENPAHRDPLARLVEEVRSALLPTTAPTTHLTQTNTARDSSVLFAVQSGTQPVHMTPSAAPHDPAPGT